MNLHIVGGFLGSGKTTAIIHAARALMDTGQVVGVITNDQGKYLVDTAFVRLSDLPAVEVTGGCFCCNYDDLDGRLNQLIESTHPDVIFAESVGSCADVVATVVKPLLELRGGRDKAVRPASFSVFTDARLLRRRLLDLEMPFSDDVVYIFDKQLEEAGLIVVNKTDLLSEMVLEQLVGLLAARFPEKPYLLQSSLSAAGVQPWLERIQSGEIELPQAALSIDYERYGAGEAKLAWLDEEVHLDIPAGQGFALRSILQNLVQVFAARGAGIGHLKFFLQAGDQGAKISIPTLAEPGWEEHIPQLAGPVTLLVNARVEMPAAALRVLLADVLGSSGLSHTIRGGNAFHPSPPKPTHRYS